MRRGFFMTYAFRTLLVLFRIKRLWIQTIVIHEYAYKQIAPSTWTCIYSCLIALLGSLASSRPTGTVRCRNA